MLEINHFFDTIQCRSSPLSKTPLFLCNEAAELDVYLSQEANILLHPPPLRLPSGTKWELSNFLYPFAARGSPLSYWMVLRNLYSLPTAYSSFLSPLILLPFLVLSLTLLLSQFSTTPNRLNKTRPKQR